MQRKSTRRRAGDGPRGRRARDSQAGSQRRARPSERREILACRFDARTTKSMAFGVVDVEHEAGDESEEKPLGKRAGRARLMPIPEEESDGESGCACDQKD